MRFLSILPAAALAFGPVPAVAQSETAMPSTIEFGPCTEFIGGYYVPEDAARALVPSGYALDVQENGVVAQVRAINCASISIQYADGTVDEGGEHILYQLGAAVLPPVELDPHPMLEGAPEITEYHAYAYNTVTSFEPLANALTRAGIGGVHFEADISFETGDDNPNSCDLVPVPGAIGAPAELTLSFSGMVRDLGLQPEDQCEFGPNDITVSERAVWYTDGPFGMAMSDTAVPRSQVLLFNANPETYAPLPVAYGPTGATMLRIGGTEVEQFSFTMSGILERGEVFTNLRVVSEN
mgnify:CR=1 FL=1